MKKFMALPTAVIMALTVTGCGSKPVETTTAGTTAAETATNADAMATESAAEEETSAVASGKKYIINMDTTFAPFESENEKGEMVDISLDILQAIAQDQGSEYGVVPTGFSAATTTLEVGERDSMIAGMSITDGRVQEYGFSEPYYDFSVGMAVLPDSDIASYDQSRDQRMATKIGTEGCTPAGFIAKQYSLEVIQCESSSDMYQAVIVGEAVACFEDYPVIGYEISRGSGLALPTPTKKGSPYGFTTLKGASPELVEMFNRELENIKISDRYDEVLNTYIAK